MKASKIFLIIVIICFGIGAFQIFQNETKSKIDRFGGNTGYINDQKAFNDHAEYLKSEERNQILMIVGTSIFILFLAFNFFKKKEDKKDPVKNLENLKNNSIISPEEYEAKLLEAKKIEQQNKIQNQIEKETNKMIEDLENLKEKGIISEEEFKTKLEVIQSKFLK